MSFVEYKETSHKVLMSNTSGWGASQSLSSSESWDNDQLLVTLSLWRRPHRRHWWQTSLQPLADTVSRRFYRSSSLLDLFSGTVCRRLHCYKDRKWTFCLIHFFSTMWIISTQTVFNFETALWLIMSIFRFCFTADLFLINFNLL